MSPIPLGIVKIKMDMNVSKSLLKLLSVQFVNLSILMILKRNLTGMSLMLRFTMLNKAIKFLNLTDFEGRLSITNVAVYIALIKLATAPAINITEAGTLLVALINYSYKKHLISKQETQLASEDTDISKTIADVKSEIAQVKSTTSALALSVGIKQ